MRIKLMLDLENLRQGLLKVDYERLSFDYHNANNELEALQSGVNVFNTQISDLNEEIRELENKKRYFNMCKSVC